MNIFSETDIILASQSPRRQQLLSELGVPFRTLVLPNIHEEFPSHLSGKDIPIFLAQQKAKCYQHLLKENTLVITADTMVFVDDKPIGKPNNLEEAKYMLRQLSNTTHSVITGVCLQTIDKNISFYNCTFVEMAPINAAEIDYYLSNYQPLDKAGSYGVQEWIGFACVKSITGSYSNVMGLPTQQLYQELKEILGGFPK